MSTNILVVSSCLAYLLAVCWQAWMLFSSTKWGRVLFFSLSAIALFIHASLLHRWIDISAGQNLTLVNVLSLMTWLSALVALLIALRIKVLDNLSLFLYPVAIIVILLASLSNAHYIMPMADRPKELIHALLSILTFAVLVLAAMQALILSIQNSLLHSNRFAILNRLPPLESMENVLFQLIWAGFVLLTTVLISSWLFFPDKMMTLFFDKTLLSLAAWIIFAVLLLGRSCLGWRGGIAIKWTLGGMIVLCIAYFGTRTFL